MRGQRGFTLIEVLIAATILFVAIAVVSETYRGAMLASRRADTVAAMLTPLPLIVAAVRSALRDDPAERREGASELLGVRYRFDAISVRFEPPPRRFDPDTAEFREYAPRFRLYDVRLVLRYRDHERTYLYQELAWLPLEG
jgi:prepilin-type N-terminal cleavage/methylation domain-containing protein